MDPLTKDHCEIATDEDQRWHDQQESKIDADYDEEDRPKYTARQRWLDGVDNGNRDRI
jgi:hypothetical protein